MAKAKKIEIHESQGQLFPQIRKDYNPFWMSSLFSDVYLKNDVPRVYKHLWENDEIENLESGFAKFYQGFVDLAIHHEKSKFETWNEAQTVKDWIVPIMDLLGWENNSVKGTNSYLDNETFNIENQTYKPDLIYFDKPKHKEFTQKHKKDVTLKLNEIRNPDTGAKIVIEAKHWNRLSSHRVDGKKDAKLTDSAVSLGPELQTLKYMEVLGLDFGILTDGKIWKLFHKELSKSVDKRSFTFDLGKLKEIAQDLLSHGQEEIFRANAKYFYYFFAKSSFFQINESKVIPLVREVFEHSRKYAHEIEENLKKRFIITMGLTCNALKNSCKRQKEDIDLETIRNVSESHLFNILFVKSCEVRQILPIKSPNYLKVSLHEVIEYLDYMNFDPEKGLDTFFKYFQTGAAFGGKDFSYDGFQIFDRFINLYEIIHDGTAKSKDFGFEIEGFKESIFNKEEWKFAARHRITNGEMIKILFTLNFIESNVPGRNYQQIPYSYFTPRQLGSIYESFLDYKLEESITDMIFRKGQWQIANLKSDKVRSLNLIDNYKTKKGELFFSPDNEDRKMTGAFYTPDHIVKYIVEQTLNPLVVNKSTDDILNLKICDPSMGSGHFLAGAIDFLVHAYRRKWGDENNDDIHESVEETSRKILNSCIFGVDINPRSVKLANMSLWLMTAYPGKKLEKLSGQLFAGDSLDSRTFDWKTKFKSVFGKHHSGFNAIIGNPPYVFTRGNLISENDKCYYTRYKTGHGKLNLFAIFFERSWELLESQEGQLSFICPSNIFRTTTYSLLREYIINECKVKEISIPDHHVFEGVTAETVIVTLAKNASNKKTSVIEFDQFLNRKITNTVNVDAFKNNIECVFSLNVDPVSQSIFNKLIKPGHPLEHYTDYIIEGIVTMKGKDKFISDKMLNKNYRKYIEGRDIGDYVINYKGKFINYDRKVLHRARPVEVFEAGEKVLIQRISGGIYPLKASYDDNQFYTYASINNIILKNEYKKWHKYLCALFNSNLFNYYYGMNFTNFSNLTVNIAGAFLEKLPVFFDEKKLKEVDTIMNKILSSGDPNQGAITKLNEIFYQSYGLNNAEIEVIEKRYKELGSIAA
jgi:hypothetical protein